MRAFILIGALALVAEACTVAGGQTDQSRPQAANGNDCAVVAAVAKEHYKFSDQNPAPPLKGAAMWKGCDWAKLGVSFTPYNDANPPSDPRHRLQYVEFQKPAYDGNGATINTSIMHGPLAGMGYSCKVVSGFAAWTVQGCKVAWVS